MENDKLEELFKLGVLQELISKCQEMVQGDGICGGHRGCVDDLITQVKNEVFYEVEKYKKEISKSL